MGQKGMSLPKNPSATASGSKKGAGRVPQNGGIKLIAAAAERTGSSTAQSTHQDESKKKDTKDTCGPRTETARGRLQMYYLLFFVVKNTTKPNLTQESGAGTSQIGEPEGKRPMRQG